MEDGFDLLLSDDYFARLLPADVHILFAVGQKVCKNPTAASAAMEVSDEAGTVVTASAEAERKVNGDSVVRLKKRTHRLAGVEMLVTTNIRKARLFAYFSAEGKVGA